MSNESHVYTFNRTGLTVQDLSSQMSPGATLVVSPQLPQSTTRIQLDADSTVHADRLAELVAACGERGFTLLGTDLPNLTPRTISQAAASALTSDFTAVPADDWKTVRSQSIETRGATSLAVVASINASDVDLGVGGTARARLRISGGPWGAGTSLRGGSLSPTELSIPFNHPVVIPPQGSNTTITVTLDVKVTGIGSQLTVSAQSDPEGCGAALSLAEHT